MNETALRNRAVVLLVAGTLVAGVTAWAAWRVLSAYQHELVAARHPEDRVQVAVAVHDLPAGHALVAGDLELREVDGASAPADEIFPQLDAALGQVVQSPVLAGEVLRRPRLTEAAVGSPLAAAVGKGMRAVSVSVDRAAGVDGKLRRGDRVDVIVTIKPDDNRLQASWVTETILQGVRVLDDGAPPASAATVDSRAAAKAPPAPEPKTVTMTLELDPDEAERLAMASARGDLRLALRGRDDLAIVDHPVPLVTNSLVGLVAPPSPERIQRAREQAAQVSALPSGEAALVSAEVIQGSDSRREQFDASGRRLEDGRRAR